VINGATHGDEYEGPTVLRELVASINPRTLRGTLVIVPVLHESAFFAGSSCHPADGSNLARAFPGNPRGNQAERVASLFLGTVLRHADFYIDLHSGGVAYDFLPWSGYLITGRPEIDGIQRDMAACFDDYWCCGSPRLEGRTLSSAADEGIPAIYTESRGGGGVHPDDRKALHRGLRNFLIRFGFLKGPAPRLRKVPIRLAANSDETQIQHPHPAPSDGLFIPAVSAGEHVRKNALLGVVCPMNEESDISVRAKHRGSVVAIRRRRSVRARDNLATVVLLAP
jgi:predicted deacylase